MSFLPTPPPDPGPVRGVRESRADRPPQGQPLGTAGPSGRPPLETLESERRRLAEQAEGADGRLRPGQPTKLSGSRRSPWFIGLIGLVALVFGLLVGQATSTDERATQEAVDGALYIGESFTGDDFTGSSLAGADFTRAHLRNVVLVDVDLNGARFIDSWLEAVKLTRAQARGADFSGACLRDVSFAGVILRGADFSLADIRGASFDGADLTGTTFDSAVYDDATMWPAQIPANVRRVEPFMQTSCSA